MPLPLIYLGVMLAVIFLWFLLFKRPVYEAIFVSFIVLVLITNTWGSFLSFIDKGLATSLLYTMVVFVAMSQLLTKTKVIDSCVEIILALLGRIPGGAGYVAIIASSFMGALSGSGPGNVMATGVITIPTMKRSGFPAELAANVESNASYLGNMIPPSSNIVAAFGAYVALYPNSGLTTGTFWLILWGISLWFILLKLITCFIFCKYYKVKPVAKEDMPSLRETLRKGWKGLLLPLIIFIPFLIDATLKETFLTARLGAGASNFSSSLLLFVPGIAAIYSMLISKDKSVWKLSELAKTFSGGLKSLCGTISPCVFGYMIGNLFTAMDVGEALEAFILSLQFGKFGMVLLITIMTCFMGMIIPGSSMVVMFGPAFITVLSAVGINPLLAAAMLPCICGTMCGITPPLALGMYAGMSIAESDFGKTVKNDLWWVAGQYVMEVIVLMGWLPILGL